MTDHKLYVDMEFVCHECNHVLKVFRCNPEINRFMVVPCPTCEETRDWLENNKDD